MTLFTTKATPHVLKGDKTLADLAETFDIHANQVAQRKTHFWMARRMCARESRVK